MSPVSSNSSHPPAVYGKIVGWNVNSKTVERTVLAAVQTNIPTALAGLIASYASKTEGVFAEDDWNELGEQVAPAPLLPLNIEAIWEGPCPVFRDEKVNRTHVAMYLPKTVGNKPLTLKTLGEIAKRYFQGKGTGYAYIWHKIENKMGNKPVDRDCWFFLTNSVIDESRSQSCETQQTMIKKLAKKTGIPYTVPPAVPAVIGILAHCIRNNQRLFSDSYTQCQESIDDKQVVVGGFSAAGLEVDCNYYGYKSLGVAALWEVSPLEPGKVNLLDKLKRSVSEYFKR